MHEEHRRARIGIVVVVLIGLVLATVTRQFAAQRRGATALAAATPLSRMNSYALALLLGGLRGPLVMFLWPSSEGQKSEKNLEDFDTKVEWIRLLQAEFDSVHIFQIWNKAYNISVLMANLANKYATILDALDYARSVDAERPNNLNILTAIAGIYGEKLGSSAERNYYKSRVREESKAREALVRVTFPAARRSEFTDAAVASGATVSNLSFAPDEKTDRTSVTLRKSLADAVRARFTGEDVTYEERPRQRQDRDAPGFRRTELDPMLDAQGNLLPEYLTPRRAPVAGNDGSELQFLKPFEPFPYGVSAHALAYNYQKRAQNLLRGAHQHHAQLSDMVVDSRPALSLRNWSEDEWERGRRAELEAFGAPVPPERAPADDEVRRAMEHPTAPLPPNAQPVNRAALAEAIFSYDRSARVAEESLKEYDEHLERFRANFGNYQSHKGAIEAQAALVRGDADYLRLVESGGQNAELARQAAEHYREAARRYQAHLLRFYLEPGQERHFPQGVTKENLDEFAERHPQQLARVAEAVRAEVVNKQQGAAHIDEWSEYYNYIRRAEARLQTLQGAGVALGR